MRFLCLVDGHVIPPDRWMWNHLPQAASSDQVDFLGVSSPDTFPRWGKILTYYPYFFKCAFEAILKSRQNTYDLIITWESKIGFSLAILRTLLGLSAPKLLTLAFSYKGIAMYSLPLGKIFIRTIDHITVPSLSEVNYYSNLLSYPRERITHVPLGGYEIKPLSKPTFDISPYVFSGGRSERDYDTLFKAVTSLNIPIVVNARRFNVQGLKCPKNVTINKIMPADQYFQIMNGTRFIVVPIQETNHAAGIISILQAMSIGKAVIATRTQSTRDYIEDGTTGILVDPSNPKIMREAIVYLWQNPEFARKLGEEAQKKYNAFYTSKAFAMRNYQVIKKLL